MKPSKGYYSIIQYCPDLGRLEAANVGVLLFCPERGFLKARTAPGNSRISRFFGAEGHDWHRINSFKKGLEHHLEREQSQIRTLEDLNRLIALQEYLLQITPPRPMKVADPEKDLQDLYVDIMGEPAQRTSTKTFRRYIGDRFTKAGLDNRVRRDIRVLVPAFEREVEIPFGFRNGRFNLISPVKFEAADPEHSVVTACKYAVEGRSLYENPDHELGDLQLVIVGRFRTTDQDSPSRVSRILRDHQVSLYRADQLPTLIDEIRRTGVELAGSQ